MFNISKLDLSITSYAKSNVLHSKWSNKNIETVAMTAETWSPKAYPKITSGYESTTNITLKMIEKSFENPFKIE